MPEPHDHGKNLNETSPAELIPKSLMLQVYDILMTHSMAIRASDLAESIRCKVTDHYNANACSCPETGTWKLLRLVVRMIVRENSCGKGSGANK